MTTPKSASRGPAAGSPTEPGAGSACAALERALAAIEAFQLRMMAVHETEFTTTDLTMAQAKLLYVVTVGGELTMSEIAARLKVSLSTASGAVDHLVGLGMLSRADDPANRRQVRVSATALGTATLEQIRELGAHQVRALLEGIDDASLEIVERAIRILTEALETQPQ